LYTVSNFGGGDIAGCCTVFFNEGFWLFRAWGGGMKRMIAYPTLLRIMGFGGYLLGEYGQ